MSNAMIYHAIGLMVRACITTGYNHALCVEILLSLTVLLQPDSNMTDLSTCAFFFSIMAPGLFSFCFLFALLTAPGNS
jgi:hypothetical protein